MVNKRVFNTGTSRKGGTVPKATICNEAGGRAYQMSDRQALAQIAATNTFNGTYYTTAEQNLALAKEIAQRIDDSEFLAKVAIFSRDKAYMKDMPAFLCVVLASRIKPDTFRSNQYKKYRVRNKEAQLFHAVFDRVIDNGKMLRNFIQIARSGAVGKKFNVSSGAIRKAIQRWFDKRSPESLFKASIGNDPSLRDILRMARPKANAPWKNAFFRREVGKEVEFGSLPEIVQQYENFKRTKEGQPPKVDFRLLDSLGLSDEHWKKIAMDAPWQMTRMNLNTFQRHNVFNDDELVELVAKRLRDPELVSQARAFPYQLMNAYINSQANVPVKIGNALQDAMELAVDNVPEMDGKIYICIDTSGSMSCSVTGGSTYGRTGSAVRCVDVASLFASSILRKNPEAQLLPFDTSVHQCNLNPRDTVITNAQKLAKFGGGGTDCSAPLRQLNQQHAKGDAVIFISDYESWVEGGRGYYYYGTGMLTEWETFKKRNPKAKLICIDLIPRANSQVKEHKDVLQVGGFSDAVWDVVASFIDHGSDDNHWVSMIETLSVEE